MGLKAALFWGVYTGDKSPAYRLGNFFPACETPAYRSDDIFSKMVNRLEDLESS